MITAIEYVGSSGASLYADKDVKQRGVWHLATISGNGLPDITAAGNASYNVAGVSYNGIEIGDRLITLDLYLDAASAVNAQEMLDQARRVVSLASEALGILRLQNASGQWYRIYGKCTALDIDEQYIRAAKVRMDIYCPFAWFEDDAAGVFDIVSATGGKIYPLERPYMFGNYESEEATSGSISKTVEFVNGGDMPAPFIVRLYGEAITDLQITAYTYKSNYYAILGTVRVGGMPSTNGFTLSTDVNDLGAWLGNGTRANVYIKNSSQKLTELQLPPGKARLKIDITGSTLTAAGSVIECRGRYSYCL